MPGVLEPHKFLPGGRKFHPVLGDVPAPREKTAAVRKEKGGSVQEEGTQAENKMRMWKWRVSHFPED